MLKKSMAAALAIISFAALSFGHLPSRYDASLRKGQTGFGTQPAAERGLRGETRSSYSFRGAWHRDSTYRGDFTIARGDTVTHGTWPANDPSGRKLVWWAKFAASGADEPGVLPRSGGTSAWVLVNSLSASQSPTGTPNPQWRGWNGDIVNHSATAPWAIVPTWRNGAQGAYSFTHDDIGAMPFETAVRPGWNVAKEFPQIKQGWGIFVREMTDTDWDLARQMVLEGHEMFNHSYDHTSAADRWFILNPGDRVSEGDLDIPAAVRGKHVVGAWTVSFHHVNTGWSNAVNLEVWNANGNGVLSDRNGDWQGPLGKPYYENGTYIDTLRAENALVTIYAFPYWEGVSPNPDAQFVDGRSTIMKIVPKPGTETITLETGQQLFIRGNQISVNSTGWFEEIDIMNRWPFYNNRAMIAPNPNCPAGGTYVQCDRGRPGFILKMNTAIGWDATAMTRNVRQSNNIINERIYSRIGATPHFRNEKRSEYFGYPFDVYSEGTHAYLEGAGFVGARGGAKSGVPMPSDFFHPYRIDFDAFFIERNDWTPASQGPLFVYPANAHVLLGLNQMVDEIIKTRGYMIREFHSVADFMSPTHDWYNNDLNPDNWPVNNPGLGKGGWWGGIAAFQLRQHYQYLQERIDARQIVVYTPSEAIKYRITANAVTGVSIVPANAGNNYTLTVNASPIAEKYRDEISVIIALRNPTTQMAIEYGSGAGYDRAPYRRPIPMDNSGRVWSVNVNPFRGPATIIPNAPWNGVPDGPTSISERNTNSVVRQNPVSFAGIQSGRIALNLRQAGNYTVELYNVQGRLVGKTDINAMNGVVATNLRTDNLGKGMFILNVKQAGKLVLNSKIMVK